MQKAAVNWTPEQEELLDAQALPYVAVLADAGSGKTSVLVERVRRIVLGKTPQQKLKRILCLSFTEKSAADLKARLSPYEEVDVFTIHAFCARVLREFGAKLLNLSPLWHVMDEVEGSLKLEKSFYKVLRRTRDLPLGFSVAQVFDVIKQVKLSEEPGDVVIECADPQQGAIFKKIISDTLTDFRNEKKKRSALSYDDLEEGALKLSSHEEVRGYLLNRYGHLFIDEFQDTSEAQALFLEHLFLRGLGSARTSLSGLFVVGDEKQSIYRFRGADVRVFRKFIEPLEKRRLSFNFRSHPKVIAAVNETAKLSIEGFMPASAGRSFDSEGHVMILQSEDMGIPLALRLLAEKNIPLENTVLLLPRLSGASKKLAYLELHGITYSVQTSGGLLFHPQLSKLANLWISFAVPHDALRKLRAECDFGYEIMNRLKSRDFSARTSLFDWLRNFLEAGILNAYGVLFLQFWSFMSREAERGKDPWILAQEWMQLEALKLDAAGMKNFAPPPFLTGVLRVMTVHASKGLEFPAVILADLKGKKTSSRSLALKEGKKLFIPSRDADGEWERFATFDDARLSEQELETHESARLLYVALTRAENALVVVDDSSTEKKIPATTPWVGWLRDALLPFPGAVPQLDLDRHPLTPELPKSIDHDAHLNLFDSVQTENPNYHGARKGVTKWLQERSAGSETLGADKKLVRRLPSEAEKIAQPKPDAKIRGTELHSVFERARTLTQLEQLFNARGFICPTFLTWLKNDEQAKLLFPEFYGPARHINIFRELSVEGKDGISPEIFVGRIDKLILDTSRRRALLVDYKWIEGSSRSPARFAEQYSSQVKFYINALMRCAEFRDFSFQGYLLDVGSSTGTICHCVFP